MALWEGEMGTMGTCSSLIPELQLTPSPTDLRLGCYLSKLQDVGDHKALMVNNLGKEFHLC